MQVRLEREALPVAACSTCCSGSRATIRTGTGGWRLSPLISPSVNDDSASLLKALRRELRARRRAVPPALRRLAAIRLARAASSLRSLRPGRRVGIYLPLPEEMDTRPLRDMAARLGCRLFVPRITDYQRSRMRFVPIDGPLRKGRYGILEPDGRRSISARQLDLVFMPLVGFDLAGNRLGMGKGYYDRAFAFLLKRRHWTRPHLVGVAFDCQRVQRLPVRAHDVPLSQIATESGLHRCPAR